MKNYRASLGTFFSWCRRRRYWLATEPLPTLDLDIDEDLVATSEDVLSPNDFQTLLSTALQFDAENPDFTDVLPILLMGGLAGIRIAEISRLDWSAINLSDRRIVVANTKAKTRATRAIHICDSLADWLRLFSGRTGRIVPLSSPKGVSRAVVALATKCGINWPRNALRNSWISYRLVLINDDAAVALEAGNSPSMMHRYYKELVTARAAQDWFAIRPSNRVSSSRAGGN